MNMDRSAVRPGMRWMPMPGARRLAQGLAALLLALVAAWAAPQARADDDPPGRVGRLADLRGHVWRYDPEQGAWVAANPNHPLTGGDRLATDGDARAELRVGSTTLRLGAGSQLAVRRLDDARLSFELRRGELALRVRSHEAAVEADIVTGEARLQPLRSGLYRVDRIDDSTYAGAWTGALRVGQGDESFTVGAGQRVEVWRDGPGGALQSQDDALPHDGFAAWVARAEADDTRLVAYRYVSPEMTGAEDLDAYGQWEQLPDVGPVWVPTGVPTDWAPYRYGHWAWVAPWGWTWIDDAPWGFAPFHYGRWLVWGGRWCWSPGAYRRQPVYAPALVAWVGGGGFSVSIGARPLLPAVGWVPLAPREVFVPYYHASRDYDDRVNHRPRGGPPPEPPPAYRNQDVPGAVTVVPRQVIEQQQPVAPGWMRDVAPVRPGRPERGFAPVPPPPPPRAAPP
ncbi:MAG: hypothetical protein KGK09_12360, partial [Burkholderiales bacterium]|nr:hypothetical protein [Burkholderiales bacterium]